MCRHGIVVLTKQRTEGTKDMTPRAARALEILKNGGHFWVGLGHDRFGKQDLVHELIEAGNKYKTKGYGLATMRELEPFLNKKQDKLGFDFGVYRLIDRKAARQLFMKVMDDFEANPTKENDKAADDAFEFYKSVAA